MNPHNIGYRMAEHSFRQADPGTGEIIPYKEHGQVVGLTVAGTETNTVQAPAKAGQKMTIFVKTYTSGARTVTFKDSAGTTTGVNQTGDSTVVFNAAGDSATFETREVSADVYAWKLVAGEGNPTDLGDATFDDVTVLDDLTVAGEITVSGSSNSTMTGDGGLVIDTGPLTVTAGAVALGGTVQMGSTVTMGATASIVTVSDGDGATNLIPKAQVLGTTKATGSLLVGVGNTTNDSTVSPSLCFVKSAGASLATAATVVAANEVLGDITWYGSDTADFESPAGRIYVAVHGTAAAGDMPGQMVFQTTADGGETLTNALFIGNTQNVAALSPTGGLGYGTGAGGTVTQITSSSTAVTLNKVCGQITTVALTTAAAAEEAFVVNNSTIVATDVIAVSTTYAGAGKPIVSVTNVGSGVFTLNITNVHAANALDAVLVINFAVLRVATT